jgi:hypothetical protein
MKNVCYLHYNGFLVFKPCLAGTFFFVRFFYKINKNEGVGKDLNCHIIVILNKFNFTILWLGQVLTEQMT